MINETLHILIRTHHRPNQFFRCMNSVELQTYPRIKVLISAEDTTDMNYVGEATHRRILPCHIIQVKQQLRQYGYNLHCNALMEHVHVGWFMFLDDDDMLIDKWAVERIMEFTDHNRPIICQMERNEIPKPSLELINKAAIVRGKIGMPCIIVPVHKKLMTMQATEDADYHWIKETAKDGAIWVPIPVVNAGKRSHGQPEEL